MHPRNVYKYHPLTCIPFWNETQADEKHEQQDNSAWTHCAAFPLFLLFRLSSFPLFVFSAFPPVSETKYLCPDRLLEHWHWHGELVVEVQPLLLTISKKGNQSTAAQKQTHWATVDKPACLRIRVLLVLVSCFLFLVLVYGNAVLATVQDLKLRRCREAFTRQTVL